MSFASRSKSARHQSATVSCVTPTRCRACTCCSCGASATRAARALSLSSSSTSSSAPTVSTRGCDVVWCVVVVARAAVATRCCVAAPPPVHAQGAEHRRRHDSQRYQRQEVLCAAKERIRKRAQSQRRNEKVRGKRRALHVRRASTGEWEHKSARQANRLVKTGFSLADVTRLVRNKNRAHALVRRQLNASRRGTQRCCRCVDVLH